MTGPVAAFWSATAKAAPDLKRLAGAPQGGRKLAKPVLHYSLSWAQDETPTNQEMSRAVDGSLEAQGLGGPRGADRGARGHPAPACPRDREQGRSGNREGGEAGQQQAPAVALAEGYEREQGRIRCEERVKNNARRRAGQEVAHNPWDRPLHWARYRREGMQPGRARRASAPADEERVDMEAWRRAEAQAWEKVEDGRWLGFWRLETRARKEWAELHKRQEDMRQRLDRESRTVLGRLRIWRIERSLRELVGAVRGREDLVEGWREDLDRYLKGERAALGKAHGESARQIERKVRQGYRKGLRGAERRAREVRESKEREGTWGRERGPSITRVPPPTSPAPRPRAWWRRVRAMTLAEWHRQALSSSRAV